MAKINALFQSSYHLVILFLLFFSQLAISAPLPKESVPDPLKTWVPWVLHGADEQLCPYLYNNSEIRQCSWPSRVILNLGSKGGAFTQHVLAFRTLWMPLPGDAEHWPQDVTLDGKPAPVVQRDDAPGIVVPKGAHTLAGSFVWKEVPEHLPLPPSIGLVELSLNGTKISVPKMDAEGRLWLRRTQSTEAKPTQVDLRVHRLVSDDIPMMVTTHIDLNVSGQSKEVVLPHALLPGFVPLSLEAPLPARVESDGRLRVQVRQGEWKITLSGRIMTPQKSLSLPKSDASLAPEEVWAFDARNDLRLVTVEGVSAIDPQQTTLPQEWKHFPAYRMEPGLTLKLVETKRGDPEPAPDRLTLNRRLWLDFNGQGFTIQDNIKGSITRAWRLEMAKPQTLGRVAVGGADQYITQTGAGANPGVELRQGQAQITADSRLDEDARTLSATGWMQDFDQLSAQLHLPPGWKLLHASGVDRAQGSWIERWTLLDFFLVLIVTLACGKLFGWRWGTVALFALILSYHEVDAPRWAWVSLLAAVALLRVLPEGRLRAMVSGYKWLSIVTLVILLAPFAIGQIRQMLYPVLERPWQTIATQAEAPRAPVHSPAPAAAAAADESAAQMEIVPELPAQVKPKAMEEVDSLRSEIAKSARAKTNSYGGGDLSRKDEPFAQIDPNAKIQTGPGLPNWQWNDYGLIWSGPVQQTQQVRLWLISPAVGAVLTITRLALLFALFSCLVGGRLSSLRGNRKAGSALATICCIALLGFANERAYAAEMPTPEILNQLKEKLLAPPECLPNCAEISRLKLEVSSNSLKIRLEAQVEVESALPLPGGVGQWLPDHVFVNGKPALGLMRDDAGNLWVQLPRGVHQLAMESSLEQMDTVNIALPLKPRYLDAAVNGWTLDGLGANGEAGESLQLSRIHKQRGQRETTTADQLPPFVRVERKLNLGLTWQVTTSVVRVGPSTAPVLVEIPLLAGESVTTSDVAAPRGIAVINLGPQTNEFSFESTLKETSGLVLKAPSLGNQIQVWRLNLGPQWHATLSGIPVTHHQGSESQWLPEWRPWPGEEAKLTLTRPAGIEGQTLTMDRSGLYMSPGIRATDARLTLSIRSSRGGQHALTLPEGAQLQGVTINGIAQPIRAEGRSVKLPIMPGKQEILLTWREPRGMESRFSTSPVDVGLNGVNGSVQISMPRDRWLLLVGGPSLGPAILIWGVVIALVFIAIGLARIEMTPLKWRHWLLLGLGLTQIPLTMSVIVVGWLIVLGVRKRFGHRVESGWRFNLGQIALAFWTMAALVCLFWAVQQG
ncbi:MAG TPA: hypothetical protein VM532_09760, partial [Burkholderiales bacterium]|nr:hypothetical protein [Burkholderiales bacterium]